MRDIKESCKIALIQASPILFNKEATIAKAIELIHTASSKSAELIVFPESFVPCYPYGMTFGFTVGSRTEEGRKDWKLYYDNSMVVPSSDTERIAAAAKEARAYVSLGITERDSVNSTLYCTNIIFSPEGDLVAKHRKLKPTGAERYIWGDADHGYFPIVETPWGNMGCLICWENYMPLARAALYEKGVTLYLAPNTNNNPEWQNTIRHIALEGRCYLMNVNQYVTKDMYPNNLHCSQEIGQLPENICTGGSCVVDPYGHYATEPVWGKEEIIYTDIDTTWASASKMEFDPVGHYSRPDVLKLQIFE